MARQIYQAVVDGILGGGVYALMAVGLTLIFGVLDIINIAQGILVVVGAYLSYVLSVHLHIDLFLGLLITVPAMFVIGVAIHWAFIRPLRGRERTSMSLLACYAVAIIIEGVLYRVFGPNYVYAAGLVHHDERARVRVLPALHLPVRVRARRRPGGRCSTAAVPDQVRPQRPGHHAGPDGGPADRDQREPGGRPDLRHRRRGHRRGRHDVRRDQRRLQPQQRLRPDLPAAGDHHPGRARQHRRRAGRGAYS